MTTPNQYWEFFRKMRAELMKMIPSVKNATVVGLTKQGEAIIQFDGDALPSKKTYPCFTSYAPVSGDRVQIINGIIQGGWKA